MRKEEKATLRQSPRNFTKRVIYVILISIVLGVVLFIDLATPFGGNIHFYSEWTRCGTRPYQGNTLLGGHVEYYAKAPVIGILRGYQTKYYCTPLDAEKAGLSADPHQYQFPELEKMKQE